ncbi:MAG: protein-L-isoaspartate O-methyltransferase [Halobacteriaceae archaeon]
MDFGVLRDDMVDSLEHDTKAVIETPRIADALRTVPRHTFLDEAHRAYLDKAFEHWGTRVLAPSTVARLLEALAPTPGDAVLIVGAGVGYTAAAIAEIVGARHVHAIDIQRSLVLEARSNLAEAGYRDVLVDRRDGGDGLPEYAPYDRILVEAAAVDAPAALRAQLAEDGRLVYPRGTVDQSLVALTPDGERRFGPTSFDPLLVDGEQATAIERNRTVREDRERAERAAESRTGWEQDWIDWDGSR